MNNVDLQNTSLLRNQEPEEIEEEYACEGLFECLSESLRNFIGTVEGSDQKEILEEIFYDPVIYNALFLIEVIAFCVFSRHWLSKVFHRFLDFVGGYMPFREDKSAALNTKTMQKDIKTIETALNSRLEQQKQIVDLTRRWIRALEFPANKTKSADTKKIMESPAAVATRISQTSGVGKTISESRIPRLKGSPRIAKRG